MIEKKYLLNFISDFIMFLNMNSFNQIDSI